MLKFKKKKTTQLKNRQFSKKDIPTAIEYKKRCSTSLLIRGTNQTLMQCHFAPTQMAIISFLMGNHKCWPGYREIRTLVHC